MNSVKRVDEYYIDSNTVCWVEGLHQLQNVFYALAGEELEVKI